MLQLQMKRLAILKDDIGQALRQIVGLPISHVWRGFGSAIFLEIGELTSKISHKKNGEQKVSLRGQYTLMIEWSWRVERLRSIYFGSWSTDRKINSKLPELKDKRIENIEIIGRLPELLLQLSDGFWVHTFSTTEGQPQWTLFLNINQESKEWLECRNGKVIKISSD